MVVLDIEMPTHCGGCPCYDGYHNDCNATTEWKEVFAITERPNDCPLQSLPKCECQELRKRIVDFTKRDISYSIGRVEELQDKLAKMDTLTCPHCKTFMSAYEKCASENSKLQEKLAVEERALDRVYRLYELEADAFDRPRYPKEYIVSQATAELKAEKGEGE